MKPLILILAMATGLAACSGGGQGVPQAGEPPLYRYASIEDAMAAARETLPVFWTHFHAPGEGETHFRVKITHPSEAFEQDHVWVEYLQQAGETSWRGSVMIENGGNDRFQTGLSLTFDAADIVDWAYTDNGKARGAYTSRAMLDLAPDADTTNIRALYHDDPVPPPTEDLRPD